MPNPKPNLPTRRRRRPGGRSLAAGLMRTLQRLLSGNGHQDMPAVAALRDRASLSAHLHTARTALDAMAGCLTEAMRLADLAGQAVDHVQRTDLRTRLCCCLSRLTLWNARSGGIARPPLTQAAWTITLPDGQTVDVPRLLGKSGLPVAPPPGAGGGAYDRFHTTLDQGRWEVNRARRRVTEALAALDAATGRDVTPRLNET